ncbi:MAG: right-handed parallel beta-helix repeat-containing protein [Cyanobacteria bacterium J06639_1]
MTSTVSAIASIPFAEPLLEDSQLLPGLAEAAELSPSTVRDAPNSDGLIATPDPSAGGAASDRGDELISDSFAGTPSGLARASRESLVLPEEWAVPEVAIASAEGEPRVLRVTITTDENDGSAEEGAGLSLRDAVLIANSTPEHEIIELESGQTYELSIEGEDPGGFFDDRDPAFLGDLDASSTGGRLTIRTTGDAKATIDANQIHRIIQVRDDFEDNAATLIVENLILTGGKAIREDVIDDGGGAILVDDRARLDIRDSIITGNDAGVNILNSNSDGGGIANKGGATIARTVFRNNTAGDGGGLFNAYGIATVTDSTFENNTASRPSSGSNIGSGGGAFHGDAGLLEIIDSTFTGNSAGFVGGGIAGDDVSGSDGTLIVTNSTITGNTGSSGGGIGVGGVDATTIDGSTIENNVSTGNGGGISAISILDTVTVSNSTVSNNTAANDGGGFSVTGTVVLRNVDIENNSAAEDGGGINDSFATIDIDRSTIANNTAENGVGGGINGGSITRNSTIRDNVAGGQGGGIFTLSPGVVLNSTISGNTSGASGGGLSIGGGRAGFYTVTIANSTISGNTAASGGGGISVGGSTVVQTPDTNNEEPGVDYTSEVVTFAGTVIVSNSTIAANVADSDGDGVGRGGGVSNALFFVIGGPDPAVNQRTLFGPGSLSFQNSIIANNTDGAPDEGSAPDISGAARGNANNLVGNLDGLAFAVTVAPEEESLGAGSDRVTPNVSLAPLADNGGFTHTHALVPGSPAIDAGDNTKIWPESFPAPNGDDGTIDFDYNADGDSDDVLPFDQRGTDGDRRFDRVLNGTVDIGAFEGVDESLPPVSPPLVFEPSLDFIATSLAIAGNSAPEQVPSAANRLLGGDRVRPEDVPAPAAIDYGVTEGVTVEDAAVLFAAYTLNGLTGTDTEQLASAAGLLLGDPDAIPTDRITAPAVTTAPVAQSADFVRVALPEGSPSRDRSAAWAFPLGLDAAPSAIAPDPFTPFDRAVSPIMGDTFVALCCE